jgi:hypothetical protein
VIERRQDTRRERRWATALDQLDQRVQVHAALARELLGQLGVEAGLAQSRAAPGDDVGRRRAGPGPLSGSQVHIPLAHPREPFLRARSTFAPPRIGWGRTLLRAATKPDDVQSVSSSDVELERLAERRLTARGPPQRVRQA